MKKTFPSSRYSLNALKNQDTFVVIFKKPKIVKIQWLLIFLVGGVSVEILISRYKESFKTEIQTLQILPNLKWQKISLTQNFKIHIFLFDMLYAKYAISKTYTIQYHFLKPFITR